LTASWKAVSLSKLRIVFTHCERTDYSHEPSWDVRDIYLSDGAR
jgi:hypothetical protein